MNSHGSSLTAPALRTLALAALALGALAVLSCDTIFPPREGVDATAGGGGGNGGGTDQGEQIYGYDPNCNCAQGYRCDGELGCRQFTCVASGGTWREARDTCARQGMQLVAAHDEDEGEFARDLCKETEAEQWWIGGNDVLAEGEFRDEANAPLAFTRWAEGQPAQDQALDCATQDRDGNWKVASCTQKLAYVCATPQTPPPTLPVGAACTSFGLTDGCNAAQLCYEADANLGVGVCSYPCASQDECVEGTRCTTTPAGKICVARCQETWECAGTNGNLRCIHTPSGEGVCWTQGARSGEVQTAPEIVLDHIDFDTTSGGGWPRPGEETVLHVYVRNDGDGDAFGVTATVSPIGQQLYVEALSDDTGGTIAVIPAGGDAVEVVTPRLTLKSTLPLGTPAQFQLTVNSSEVARPWELTFGVTAYPSAALPYVTTVQIQGGVLAPGGSDAVTLLGDNLGFAAVSSVITTAEVVDGDATWTQTEQLAVTFPDPSFDPGPAEQRLVVGTLAVAASHPAGTPVVLGVTIIEPGGTVWEQDVEVPVQ